MCCAASLEFLGHQGDRHAIWPLEEKVEQYAGSHSPLLSRSYTSSLGSLTSTITSSRVARVSSSPSTPCSTDPPEWLAPYLDSRGWGSLYGSQGCSHIHHSPNAPHSLVYPQADAPTCLITDASDSAVSVLSCCSASTLCGPRLPTSPASWLRLKPGTVHLTKNAITTGSNWLKTGLFNIGTCRHNYDFTSCRRVKEDRVIAVMAVSKEDSFLQYCQQLDNTAKVRCQERLHIVDVIEDPNIVFNGLPLWWSSYCCL